MRNHLAAWSAAALAVATLAAAPAPPQPSPSRGPGRGHALAPYRPDARRPRARARRRAEPAERLLHRLRQRRRLALDRLRLDLGAALRRRSRPARSARSPSRRPIRTSSMSAPAPASSGPISRPATASTSPPTPARRGRTSGSRDSQMIAMIDVDPERSEPAVRRGARPSVRTERGARHLPLDRRRPDASRRCSTRTSTRAATTCASIRATRTSSTRRSGSSSRASSKAAGSAAAGNGDLQVDRRRHDVEAADRRPADGRFRRTSRSRRAIRRCSTRSSRVAPAGGRGGGASRRSDDGGGGAIGIYKIDRRRRALDARASAARRCDAASADPRPLARIGGGDLPTLTVDPKNENVVYSCSVVFWRTEDGGVDVVGGARRARRRRLSEDVDQPERPQHHPRRRRPGRGRLGESRRSLEQLVHAADGGDVSRLDRQRVPLSRLRRPAGLGLGVRATAAATTARSRSTTGIR